MIEAIAHITSKYSFCTIQDKGRYGFRDKGIYTSGPMDSFSYELSNAMLDNDENCAVLEITNQVFSLKFSHEALVSVTGVEVSFKINETLYFGNQTIQIKAGEELFILNSKKGMWKYLAIKDGWQTELILGSRCTNPSLGLQYPKYGSVLYYFTNSSSIVKSAEISFNLSNKKIRVERGPESHFFDQEKIYSAFSRSYTLSSQSNRMAYKCNEKMEDLAHNISIQSSVVFPGIIQLTPSGEFYILMNDCQTLGGYPRIGIIGQEGMQELRRKNWGELVEFELEN